MLFVKCNVYYIFGLNLRLCAIIFLVFFSVFVVSNWATIRHISVYYCVKHLKNNTMV